MSMISLLLNSTCSRYAKTGVNKNADATFAVSASTVKCRFKKKRIRMVQDNETIFVTSLSIFVAPGGVVAGDKILVGSTYYIAESMEDFGHLGAIEGESFLLVELAT